MKLTIITTGGTNGALPYENPRWPPETSSFPPGNKNVVAELLKKWPGVLGQSDYQLHGLRPVDSKDISRPYLARIVDHIVGSPVENILVTHGTDTMLRSAGQLFNISALSGKRIVLVGAMTPLLNGAASDGFQNLRFAIDSLINPASEAERAPVGVNLVLSDCGQAPGSWEPRLYHFAPGRYEKYYDPERGDRSRLVPAGQGIRQYIRQLCQLDKPPIATRVGSQNLSG
jgi:L-asparaginase/Glu-tRNA(Gln) amidotransferase subunit D